MKQKEMEKLQNHFERYFQQEGMVLHMLVDPTAYHIDVLLYRPTPQYPFWKLATMGASDFRMPVKKPSISDRNEYIMFVDGDENLDDREILNWYHQQLLEIALYAPVNDTYISYGHSFEWETDEEMVAAYIELPQIIESTDILRCKLGLMKTAACLQVVLLNREELSQLMTMGPEAFSNFLYPEDDAPSHFICQRTRTDKF